MTNQVDVNLKPHFVHFLTTYFDKHLLIRSIIINSRWKVPKTWEKSWNDERTNSKTQKREIKTFLIATWRFGQAVWKFVWRCSVLVVPRSQIFLQYVRVRRFDPFVVMLLSLYDFKAEFFVEVNGAFVVDLNVSAKIIFKLEK